MAESIVLGGVLCTFTQESGVEDALPDGWFLGRGGFSGFGWLFGMCWPYL